MVFYIQDTYITIDIYLIIIIHYVFLFFYNYSIADLLLKSTIYFAKMVATR